MISIFLCASITMSVADNLKRCSCCKELKPFSEFSKNKSRKDGYAHQCKPCALHRTIEWQAANQERLKARYAAYYAANRERIAKYDAERYAANPKRHAERFSAWRTTNIEKERARCAAWEAANKSKRKAISHNRRARKLSSPGAYTGSDIELLLTLQKNKCAVCHSLLSNGYHADHVIPLAKGGSNDKSNIQILCPHCNLSKGAKHPIDFMQERGMLL